MPKPLPSRALLICQDLFFISKVTSTAESLGLKVDVLQRPQMALAGGALDGVKLILIDLAAPGFDVRHFVASLPVNARPDLLAFGSHVDVEKLDAARQAGCDHVVPRSAFSAGLPEILRRYLA